MGKSSFLSNSEFEVDTWITGRETISSGKELERNSENPCSCPLNLGPARGCGGDNTSAKRHRWCCFLSTWSFQGVWEFLLPCRNEGMSSIMQPIQEIFGCHTLRDITCQRLELQGQIIGKTAQLQSWTETVCHGKGCAVKGRLVNWYFLKFEKKKMWWEISHLGQRRYTRIAEIAKD